MKRQLIGLAAIAALVLAGCSQDTGQSATSAGPAAPTTAAATSSSTSNDSATVNYHPVIVPADFSTRITNPYFLLKPGTSYVFDGVRDGAPQHTEMTVTNETKKIMGVSTMVVRDVVTSNGALVERTTDWYAQKRNGRRLVLRGGHRGVRERQDRQHTKGSWEAGVDNAQPGIIMLAAPATRRQLPAGVLARGGLGHGQGRDRRREGHRGRRYLRQGRGHQRHQPAGPGPDRLIRSLKQVSFRVEPAEVVAVTGPSGSGKTTLLQLLAGLDRPDRAPCGLRAWTGRRSGAANGHASTAAPAASSRRA